MAGGRLARMTRVPEELYDTADVSDVANLYSYCMESTLESTSPLRIVFLVLLLATMLGIQVIFAFGFADASQLQVTCMPNEAPWPMCSLWVHGLPRWQSIITSTYNTYLEGPIDPARLGTEPGTAHAPAGRW